MSQTIDKASVPQAARPSKASRSKASPSKARPGGFPSLADRPMRAGAGAAGVQVLDVCVVTSEILGPTKNGGIGTATSALVDRLALTGHRVTVLFTQVWGGRPLCQQDEWTDWVARLRRRGIRLVALDHSGAWYDWQEKSWSVRQFLEAHEFTLVYLNEHHASGYYALMAKRAGLRPFRDQTFAVITHGAMEWVAKTNDQPLSQPHDVTMALMERRCVEWADIVIGPSAYLLQTYRSYGWQLPEATYVQPYLLGNIQEAPAQQPQPVDEIVFFGRLEHRKGLWMFCQALDRLAETGATPAVTFLGRMTPTGGIPSGAFILARGARWPFRLSMLTDLGQEDALAYLSQPNRLAVMPSLADNSPCVVYECIDKGIPFLTCSGTGADEIVAAKDHGEVMVEPAAGALALRLAACLAGRPRTASYAFDPAKNAAVWDAWHTDLAASAASRLADGPLLQEADKSGKAKPPLTVLVDEPAETLVSLFDALADNARTLGEGAQIILASPRSGQLGDWLDQVLEIISTGTGTVISRVGPEDLAQRIGGHDTVVIMPATGRLLGPVLRQAMGLIAQQGISAVSCLSAGRPDNPVVLGHGLPLGEIPELAVLAQPLTGGICVAKAREAADHLAGLFDRMAQTGDWLGGADMSEELALRVMSAGAPFRLIPQIGAMFGAAPKPGQSAEWYPRAAAAARLAGLEPHRPADLPVWMAITHTWFERATRTLAQEDEAPPHALSQDGLVGRMALRAARHGRIATAMECAADLNQSDAEQVRQRLVQKIRSVEKTDYLPAILNASTTATAPLTGQASSGRRLKGLRDSASQRDGRAALVAAERNRLVAEARRSAAAPTKLKTGSLSAFLGSSDPRIECSGDETVLMVDFPPGGPALACLVAFDLRTDGQRQFSVSIGAVAKAAGPSGMAATLTLLDQTSGTPVAQPVDPVDLDAETSLTLPLHGIAARLTMIVTITCAGGSSPARCRIAAIGAD